MTSVLGLRQQRDWEVQQTAIVQATLKAAQLLRAKAAEDGLEISDRAVPAAPPVVLAPASAPATAVSPAATTGPAATSAADGDKKRACNVCYKSKCLCTGAIPCERCIRIGRPDACAERPVSRIPQQQQPRAAHVHVR